MHQPTHRYIAVILLAVLVATAAGVAAVPSEQTLVVTDADSGERLLEEPVDDGTVVTLSYTHSVEKTPVEDIYIVEGTTLQLDRMMFRSHGAGLPTEGGIEKTDDGFMLPLNESHEQVVVAPRPVPGHELVINGDRHDLVALTDGSVVISVTEQRLTGHVPIQLQFDDRSAHLIH